MVIHSNWWEIEERRKSDDFSLGRKVMGMTGLNKPAQNQDRFSSKIAARLGCDDYKGRWFSSM